VDVNWDNRSLDRSSGFVSDFLANNTPGEIRLPVG
jgi:hypothetical protein